MIFTIISGCNPVMTDNEENFPVQVDLQHVKAVLDVSLHC